MNDHHAAIITDPAVAMALDDIRRTLSAFDARIAAMEKSRAHPLPPVEIIEHPDEFLLCSKWSCPKFAGRGRLFCDEHSPPAGYYPRVAGHDADSLSSDVALPDDGCPLCGLPKDGALTR
jgi:hypothetical protein